MNRIRISTVLVTLLIIATFIAGCAAPQSNTQPTNAPDTSTAKPKIGLSFSDFATERWKIEADLMTKLLQEKGYDVVVQEANHDVEIAK